MLDSNVRVDVFNDNNKTFVVQRISYTQALHLLQKPECVILYSD
jgi:hypothetical protein